MHVRGHEIEGRVSFTIIDYARVADKAQGTMAVAGALAQSPFP